MAATASTSVERDLTALLGDGAVLPGNTRAYLTDATESRNLRGKADAIALPADAEQVAQVVALVLRPRRARSCPAAAAPASPAERSRSTAASC